MNDSHEKVFHMVQPETALYMIYLVTYGCLVCHQVAIPRDIQTEINQPCIVLHHAHILRNKKRKRKLFRQKTITHTRYNIQRRTLRF